MDNQKSKISKVSKVKRYADSRKAQKRIKALKRKILKTAAFPTMKRLRNYYDEFQELSEAVIHNKDVEQDFEERIFASGFVDYTNMLIGAFVIASVVALAVGMNLIPPVVMLITVIILGIFVGTNVKSLVMGYWYLWKAVKKLYHAAAKKAMWAKINVKFAQRTWDDSDRAFVQTLDTDTEGFPVVVSLVNSTWVKQMETLKIPAKTWKEALSNAGVDENEVVKGAPGSDGSLIDADIPYWSIVLKEGETVKFE